MNNMSKAVRYRSALTTEPEYNKVTVYCRKYMLNLDIEKCKVKAESYSEL